MIATVQQIGGVGHEETLGIQAMPWPELAGIRLQEATQSRKPADGAVAEPALVRGWCRLLALCDCVIASVSDAALLRTIWMSEVDRVLAGVIAAHGGAELWKKLTAVEAVLSVDGFLFTTKHVPPLKHVRVVASTTSPRFTVFEYPRPGQRGEWFGEDEVHIVANDGTILDQRKHPRDAFRGLRRELWWDSLDFLFFASYATWNYLNAPFFFLQPGFKFKVLAATHGGVVRIEAIFPPEIPSHCRRQVFHFLPNGELSRLDYTADVVGKWANAAHLCEGYRDFNGLRAPTRRRVRPLFGLRDPLPFPTLVAIDVHELRPVHL
jgi:hypothetical protein